MVNRCPICKAHWVVEFNHAIFYLCGTSVTITKVIEFGARCGPKPAFLQVKPSRLIN